MSDTIKRVALALCFAASCGAWGAQKTSQKLVTERQERVFVLPQPVKFEFSREVGAGRLVKYQGGCPGKIIKTYEVFLRRSKVVAKKLISTRIVEPKATIFEMGREGYSASRGSYVRSRVLKMVATAYDPYPKGSRGHGRTRTGLKAEYGVVAVDPRLIHLGTLLYVDGYGFAIAADTGSAIKGDRIDLCLATRSMANRYGRHVVYVHIFKRR